MEITPRSHSLTDRLTPRALALQQPTAEVSRRPEPLYFCSCPAKACALACKRGNRAAAGQVPGSAGKHHDATETTKHEVHIQGRHHDVIDRAEGFAELF